MRMTIVVLALVFGGRHVFAATSVPMRPLTLGERVAAAEALERVHHAHRVWPKENLTPKPAFELLVPHRVIEARVRDTLRKAAALEQLWCRPITTAQLQAEMDRMARDTKDPGMLRELLEALGNDPVLVAECLARPLLTDRLLRTWYTYDRGLHERSWARGEHVQLLQAVRNDGGETEVLARTFRKEGLSVWWERVRETLPEARLLMDGRIALPSLPSDSWGRAACDGWIPANGLTMPPDARSSHTAVWTGSEMIVWGGSSWAGYNMGGRYAPATDTWTATSTAGACPSSRFDHTAVWTGTEMTSGAEMTGRLSTRVGVTTPPRTPGDRSRRLVPVPQRAATTPRSGRGRR